jgi:hypothetical protein
MVITQQEVSPTVSTQHSPPAQFSATDPKEVLTVPAGRVVACGLRPPLKLSLFFSIILLRAQFALLPFPLLPVSRADKGSVRSVSYATTSNNELILNWAEPFRHHHNHHHHHGPVQSQAQRHPAPLATASPSCWFAPCSFEREPTTDRQIPGQHP